MSIENKNTVLKPILFNCWKHHKLFIQEEINKFISTNLEESIELLKKQLLIIGESQTDLYTGSLSLLQISQSILGYLKKNNVLEINEYERWIRERKSDYRTIPLEDSSCWTLRIGELKGYYVHIHPCRNSVNSIRVRSLNLKTAIAAIVWTKLYHGSPDDLIIVNKIRREILAECPVKSLKISKGITKIIQLLLT